MNWKKKRIFIFLLVCTLVFTTACGRKQAEIASNVTPKPTAETTLIEVPEPTEIPVVTDEPKTTEIPVVTDEPKTTEEPVVTDEPEPTEEPVVTDDPEATEETVVTDEPKPTEDLVVTNEPEPTEGAQEDGEALVWNENWEFAANSEIHTGSPKLYYSNAENRKDIVIAVNAGHGTKGGTKVKTLCHPDGTVKVTGGSTAAGEKYATAVSSGTSFLDGTIEATANLSLALIVKELLLEEGYDVLMIRESDDQQLDNIARTVFSNNYADCHIALHYDSTETDKGFFFIGVPDVASYRAMEPVASHWKQHNALGEALVEGMKSEDLKICGDGNIPLDLTQTSYSTIPSVDVEVGDRKSDYSEETQRKIAKGLVAGLNIFFSDYYQPAGRFSD